MAVDPVREAISVVVKRCEYDEGNFYPDGEPMNDADSITATTDAILAVFGTFGWVVCEAVPEGWLPGLGEVHRYVPVVAPETSGAES